MSMTPENPTFEAPAPKSSLTLHDFNINPRAERSIPKILRIHPVDAGAKLRAIESDQFVFGRNVDCEVIVEEDSASRRHAKIVRKGDDWLVVDLDSTNGTWVNEERVQTQRLNCGDRCLLYTSPSPRDRQKSRMPSSA